jgi:shikimate dehydrogenase
MRRFGLIGKTLKHSFSKTYFEKKFTEERIEGCSYDNFEIPSIDHINEILSKTGGLEGLNVTIPYKESILDFLQWQSEMVKRIGACNCIRIRNKMLEGFNTDAPAFSNSIRTKLQPHHECALILGSGGASKAVCVALDDLGIDYLVVSRRKKGNEIGYEEVGEELIQEHQVIINTTPLGMFPNVNEDPSIPYEALTPKHLLFDLIYNPAKTKFLQQGEAAGASIINGYEMLRFQAEESWKIWNENR